MMMENQHKQRDDMEVDIDQEATQNRKDSPSLNGYLTEKTSPLCQPMGSNDLMEVDRASELEKSVEDSPMQGKNDSHSTQEIIEID
jgi:hypothetical protein